MIIKLSESDLGTAQFAGLRMTADQFFELPEDGYNYELLDGVVVMSPSPKPKHQVIAGEIFAQLAWFLRDNPVGEAFMELDVHLGKGDAGADLVYRPEAIFVVADRIERMRERIVGAPDLVVEVISSGSRGLDEVTKKGDYERFGVREYWLVDPDHDRITFYRLTNERLVEIQAEGSTFDSEAVPGFKLDLDRIKIKMREWK